MLLACSSSLEAQVIKLDDILKQFPQIDIVGVRLGIGPEIIIIVTYIPPDLNIQVYADFLEAFSLLDAVDTMDARGLVILGDFNSPMFHGYFDSGIFFAKAEVIQSFATFFNLIQYNNVTNHMGRVLDLVFGSIECDVAIIRDPFLRIDQYHPVLAISLQISMERSRNTNKIPISKYSFYHYDKDVLFNALDNINWELLNDLSLDGMCDRFYQLLDGGPEVLVEVQNQECA